MSDAASPSPAALRKMLGERFAEHRGSSTATGGRPSILLGVDPDSTQTALCIADLHDTDGYYLVRELRGGGRRKQPVPWGDVLGWCRLFDTLLAGRDAAELLVVVEQQATDGPHHASVEPLRRIRYHCEGAAMIVGCRYLDVAPAVWMRRFVGKTHDKGPGSLKRGYPKRAKELLGDAVKNEDQAAALGIAWWAASELGCQLGGLEP